MAQAKRIKKKPAAKANKKKLRKGNLPWGLLLIILCSGIVLGMLLDGMRTQENGNGFGAGLKALFTKEEPTLSEDAEIAELIESQSTQKEFDFYEILPDIEKVMPDDLPEAKEARPDADLDYYLQAASFRKHADAEQLRARLALKGFKSVTQARDVEGDGTYYRVRLGPYPDKRKAKTAKNRLKKLGVHPFVYSVKK